MVSGVEEGTDGEEYGTLASTGEGNPTELRAHSPHSVLSVFCSFLLVCPVSAPSPEVL